MLPAAALATPIPALQRVLVPTDLSDVGDGAVPYAYGVLRARGLVHLVHVIELVSLPNPLYPHYGAGHAIGPEQRRLQHAELTVRLHALVPEEAQTLGIATRVEILEDPNIAGAITGIAERLGVDLICMSSHGRTGLSSVLAGSVARAVMAQSRRPLLLIRPSRD